MRHLYRHLFIIIFTVILNLGYSQEFQLQENGFVYDQKVMSKLQIIVDSLNLKFIQCESDPIYMAPAQAKVHSLYIKNGRETALKQIKEGVSFEELSETFPEAKIGKARYLIRNTLYKDEIVKDNFRVINPDGSNAHRFNTESGAFKKHLTAGNWIYHMNDYGLTAIYLTQDVLIQRLPKKYALMVGYADCMVDTTSQVFSEVAIKSKYDRDPNSAALEFIRENRLQGEEPKESDFDDIDDYYTAISAHNKKALDHIEASLAKDKNLRQKLVETGQKSILTGGSTDFFERLTEKFVSKEMALNLKRSRIVYGTCSMDTGPREHAIDIARLSAETTEWSVFLRSHLDLMNDNFSRASDGNYAWANRSTYIKELESLDIGMRDLLMGVTLKIDAPAENHYFGSNHRTARAIAESGNPKAYFNSIIEAIKDQELDLYNRMCMAYLAMNYMDYQEKKKRDEITSIRTAIQTLPKFIGTELLSYFD